MRSAWVVMAVLVAAGAAVGAPPKATPKVTPKTSPRTVEKAEAPGDLSPLARQLLRKRMARHGRDVLRLVEAVVMLEYDVAHSLADAIATEPRIVRPQPGASDELNSALPEAFFMRQDELRERARALAQAARVKDEAGSSARLGELMQTCVACHVTFLEPAER